MPANSTVFAAALLDPTAPVPELIKGRPAKRYAVYRNNVTVGLVRAMEANFPAIRALLGEVYFAGLAREFAQSNPPQSPLMFTYGDRFAGFLDQQSDLVDYPYLGDVARLEQQWRISYHAEDAACLTAEELAGIDGDALNDLVLKPHPALSLIQSRYAVHSILMANRGGGGIVAAVAEAENVVITRRDFEVEGRCVTAGVYSFLAALAGGNSFGAAADTALELDNSLNLADCVSTMLLAGAFQSLASKESS